MGKNKNKKRRYKQNKYSTGQIINYVIFAISALYLIVGSSNALYKNHLLKKKGLCTKAVVFKRRKTGSRYGGGNLTEYTFTWKDVIYYGKSYNDTKSSGNSWFSPDYVTGDTIIIVFLENDPDINRSNSTIEKDCGCIYENDKRHP